jgi:hypothetical protein
MSKIMWLYSSGCYFINEVKHYPLFAFSIHQKPIGSSSVTEFHISSAFDETKMIFHLLNIQNQICYCFFAKQAVRQSVQWDCPRVGISCALATLKKTC